MLADRVAGIAIAKNYRGAARPSDHVPVTATTERSVARRYSLRGTTLARLARIAAMNLMRISSNSANGSGP